MLKKTAECYLDLDTYMLDGAKVYIPVLELYCKYKQDSDEWLKLMKLYFGLIFMSSELMGKLRLQEESVDLGYYTSLTSLYFLLNDEEEEVKNRLSMFDARHMNDPNEGRVLAEYLGKKKGKNEVSWNSKIKRWAYENSTFTFLKSFTTNIDSLPMWVQYAQDGQGCFVRINQAMFDEGRRLVEARKDIVINNLRVEESYQLYRVAYFDGEKFCTSNGKNITKNIEKIREIYLLISSMAKSYKDEMKLDVEKVANQILNRVQYLIKKADYIHEDEVRIFFLRNGDGEDIKMTNVQEYGMPRVYLNLKVQTDIKEIILGPQIGNGYDKVPFIYQKLQKMKFKDDIKITQSSIEYL